PIVDNMMQTTKKGVFACGNVVHVNDLVDNVTIESQLAGKYAASYSQGKIGRPCRQIDIIPGKGIRYVVPQRIKFYQELHSDVTIYYRVKEPMTNIKIQAVSGGEILAEAKRVRSNPGEMEHIKLKAEKIKDVLQDIKINVVEGGLQ
ncbi:MAG: pyridine nucleotide-disulfide oxidoreductase, partial [Clostridia bacterium]|nr:pyridine nucleotide-disulfide oxidoreductase [Clostridia bacterium]